MCYMQATHRRDILLYTTVKAKKRKAVHDKCVRFFRICLFLCYKPFETIEHKQGEEDDKEYFHDFIKLGRK